MKLPFSVEQFFGVFEAYNKAIWPAQIVAYALAIIAIVLTLRGGRTQSRIVSVILAAFWIWMGVVYHIMHFAPVNPAARGFGILFVVEGVLLAVAGAIVGLLRFQFAPRPAPLIGILFMLYAMVIYPLLGMAFGHSYPRAPLFGVAPCPTTIFTFGILLWASAAVPVYILIVPFLWSLLGMSAAAQLGVPQDYGLVVAGVLGTALILIRNKRLMRKK